MKIYILSDSHFGSDNGKLPSNRREQLFIEFLNRVRDDADVLILLGDIFDFWFEYKHVIPNHFFRILKALDDFASSVETHFVAGNHDLWVDGFIESLGIQVHRDCLELKFENRRLFFAHGDKLRNTDLGGKTIRLLLSNRISIALFRLIHPDLAYEIARFVSNSSRKRSSRTTLPKNPMPSAALQLFHEGFSLVALGHTHIPYLDYVEGGIFLSTGDWYWNFNYAVVGDDGVSIRWYLSEESRKLKWPDK